MHHQPSYITPSVSPTDVLLAPVQALYDQGLFQQAFRAAESLGPLHSWRGTSGRLLAGRLARQLGADKLGNRQLLLAWRHDPDNWRARSFFLSTFAGMRGPVALWRRLNHYGNPPDDDPQSRADFCSLRARAASALRDFDLADHWLNEAERAGLDPVWLASERSYRLELEDRYQEALEVAQQYLAEHPGNWLVQYRITHTLQLLGRDDEALLLLRSSIPESESPFLGATLFALEVELRLYDDALRTLDWIETRVPLAEPEYRQWLAGNRAACLHYLDRRPQAVGWARQAGQDDFSKRFAEKLENPPPGASRVELPVGFVRQHHLTCVPATLTTLGRFWGKPTEHLEVAEAICYDGTPGHSERNWASSNGWVAREFTVTLPAARSLLSRGVPFALVTVYPANAHEQAVIGYDDFRESLLIRDPYYRNKSEFLAGTGLAQQAPSGPRGMAMVPMENVQLLDGLDLPDAELYDLHHKVLLALDRHDRQGAFAARQELETRAPGHRITFQSRQAIASYDANSHEQLAAVDGLRSLFPDDANLQLSRLQIMRTLARRDERLAMLREACARKKSDPLLWQELAGELALDAREHDVARRWLNRAERTRQSDAAALALRGNMGWARGEFEEACQYYRFAACLNDKSEYFATTWFRASRWLKQTNEALRFLTHRFRRDGKRSSMPARTLVWAYMELNQPKEAFAVLEQALALRPDDGDLKLFACDQYTNSGNLERAETLLSEAKSRTTTGAWARAAAAIANQRAELRPALDLWREVLAAEPLAMDAHRSIAYLLSETDSRTAALNYLASACERFPFYVPLHELRVTWLRDEGPDVYEPAVRALVEHVAESAWGRRELALALIAQDRFEEAHAELDVASQLDPNDAWLFNVRGQCFARQGRPAEARAQFRESLQRTVDDTLAMRELLGQCETPEQRGDALNFIQGELIRQTTFGDGILEFADLARPFLAQEHLLLLLQQAQTERSDLWHAWSALISHRLSMKRSDEALALANQATEVFPLVPRLWLDLAQVHRARLDRPQQVTALEQALEISPNWSYASRQLAEALHGSNKMQEACDVLKQAIARSRQDPLNHGELAALLWQLGEKQAAVAELRECLLLEPGHEWAWSRLEAWGKETGQPDLRRVLAEELTERRPGEARSWWLLGIALNDPDQLDRSLACLDKAIDRNPRFVAAWRSRAAALAAAGRYDEALAACRPPELQPTPAELRAMFAWVLSERGDIPAAIREMRAVLADHPNIDWGWRELATWHYNRGEYALAAKAADALSQMLPFDPVPLGFAAELKMHEGDRDGALKQFARAFEVDPSYTFAGFNLFKLQLENRDVEGARQTLARLRDQVREPAALEREIALEITAGNRNSIWPLLRRMCACSEDDPDSFDRLSAQLTQHKLVKQALPTVSQALRAENPNDSVAWLWVDLRLAAGHFRNTEELLRLPPRSELARRAFIRQLLAIGTKVGESVWPWNPGRRDFNRMMAAHRDWFHSDDQLWGKVGYILVNQRRYNETIEWLQDWREHRQAEPWMLENLLLALQESGREEEVRILIQDARALPRHLGSLVRFDLFDALREAYTGNPDPGRHLLTLIDEKQLDPYDASLVVFLRIALEFLSSESNTDFNREKRRQLSKALDNTRNLKAGREAFQKVTRLIADSTGKRWIRLWGKTRLLMLPYY